MAECRLPKVINNPHWDHNFLTAISIVFLTMVNIILDNGGGKVKYGIAGDSTPKTVVNSTAKVGKTMQYLVGDQIDEFQNGSLLLFNRPCDRGYLTNWQSEIEVWNQILFSQTLKSQPQEDCLILTEAMLTPETLQNDTNEVVFEYFGFSEYMRRPAPCFSAYEHIQSGSARASGLNSCLVVDSGFSFTHVVPFVDGVCQKHAVKRVNVGGKLLTNYLKEVVSYRQWNMMDEFRLMEQVKEALCFVSLDFAGDLRRAKGAARGAKAATAAAEDHAGGRLRKLFVLPDFKDVRRGYALADDAQQRPEDQVLTMEAERFSVPELLFHPSDVGVEQAGVAEAVGQSLDCLSLVEMGLAASSIVLTGGNCRLPQFGARFERDVRQFVPDMFPVEVCQPEDAEMYAWRGASRFVKDETSRGTLGRSVASRAEYLEYGHHYCNEKFAAGW